MIRTETQVPSTYSLRSRDFQLLAVLFDSVFNSSKLYSDLVSGVTGPDMDTKFLDLLAKTLGFESKRIYDTNDLLTLCSAFKSIIRKKGTLAAVEDCVKVLLKAQNIDKKGEVFITNYDELLNTTYKVLVIVPKELTDIALLEDVLDYILPTGYLYNITVSSLSGVIGQDEIDASISHSITKFEFKDNDELGHVFIPEGEQDLDDDAYTTQNSVSYIE